MGDPCVEPFGPTTPTVGEIVPPDELVEVHESVEEPPLVIVVGLSDKVQVGLEGFTVTVAVRYVVHEVKYCEVARA